MSEARRIADQLRRAFEGQAWHGDSLMETLRGVTAERAAAKPVANLHSIWEIALHIAFWENVSRRRAEGEVFSVEIEDGWMAVTDTSEAAWKKTLEDLRRGNEAFRETILRLDDAQLKNKVEIPGSDYVYNIYFMLHGVIQHDLYHTGQIALLKKM